MPRNFDSSFLTKQRQAQEIYGNYLSVNQKINQGCTTRGFFQQGAAGTFSSDQIVAIDEAVTSIGTNLRDAVINAPQNNCPIVTSDVSAPAPAPGPAPITNINLLILGTSSDATNIATYLTSAKNALAYSQSLTITTQAIVSGYTGSNLNNYDVIMIMTNSGVVYNASLGTNLNAAVANGKHLIMGCFCWGNVGAITNFSYTNYSTFLYNGSFTLTNTNNITNLVTHPITSGLPTTTGLTTTNVLSAAQATLTSGATTISQYTTGSAPFIAVRQNGNSRLVGFNQALNSPYNTYPTINKMIVNSVYWCMGLLS